MCDKNAIDIICLRTDTTNENMPFYTDALNHKKNTIFNSAKKIRFSIVSPKNKIFKY